jgi:hypothetical protein
MKNHIIYIGYDPREEQAYDVCRHSILSRTNSDIRIIALKLPNLTTIFNRPVTEKDGRLWCPVSDAPMSTEFAISRFCVPFLEDKGWALFMDCDMVVQDDITNLFSLADNRYAVMVVKHKPYNSGMAKMDGQIQSYYSRKNWSSVVLWNCEHPAHQRLTLNDLNTWPGRDLHAFKWLADDEIGELPHEWNFLVGIDEGELSQQKILHYTLGGAWFEGWERRDTDEIWEREYNNMNKKKAVNF